MTARTISESHRLVSLSTTRWLGIGLKAGIGAVLGVLLAQAAILALVPGLAEFQPLGNYARSALFTFVPALGATLVFAWLTKNRERPVSKFLGISLVVLLLSFIPDYALPIPGKTFWASTAAAFLHRVAGAVTVALILSGYFRAARGVRTR